MLTTQPTRLILRALLSCLALVIASALPAAAKGPGGYTNMSFDRGHGTQIEFMSTDGKAFLWYPGNKSVLPGKWKIEGSNLCFAYTANSYNPVTGHKGDGYECGPLSQQQSRLKDRAKGDIFGLAGLKKVPFILDHQAVTFKQVSARIKNGGKAPESETLSSPQGIILECKAIIANAETNMAYMAIAASTYFHGQFMGKPCVKVDYARAIDLATRSKSHPEQFIKVLRERAAQGHPSASTALRKLGYDR